MGSNDPDRIRQPWSSGRGFASADPERQREVVGYARPSTIDTEPAPRSERLPATRLDWMRVTPERDSANFEGSSSRRGR